MYRCVKCAVLMLLCYIAACGDSVVHVPESAGEQSAVPKVERVNSLDIPTKVKLAGRFGAALGEDVVTVRGKWKEERQTSKSDGLAFVVSHVNGKGLKSPIAIPCESVDPFAPRGSITADANGIHVWTARIGTGANERLPDAFDGDEWEMMGFEAGESCGWPRRIGEMYLDVQQTLGPGAFRTSFRPVTVRLLGKLHKKGESGGFPFGDDEPDPGEDPSKLQQSKKGRRS
jgi:hypothetical protein